MALGGGLELAATCDLRIGGADAAFGLPEADVGVVPGWSGTQRLVRTIGPAPVKLMALVGERLDAAAAERAGVLHRTVAAGTALDAALDMAARIAARAPVAVQLAKQLINAAVGEDTEATLEALAAGVVGGTQDTRWRQDVHGRRLQLPGADRGRRRGPQPRAAGHLRSDSAGGIGCAVGAGRGRCANLPWASVRLLEPTVPLSRLIFRTPTQHYKTGVVFLAYLNRYQNHFVMVGGAQAMRPLPYFAALFRLADGAGLLRDPECAVLRMQRFLGLYGIDHS